MTDQRAIQVGDLVVVVRGHDCALGFTFRVASFCQQTGGGWTCPRCRARDLAPEALTAATWRYQGGGGFPTGWLKRIPPLDELEGERTDEQIKEKV